MVLLLVKSHRIEEEYQMGISTRVRRPPGCHSDGPLKPHMAAVLARTKKMTIVNRKLL